MTRRHSKAEFTLGFLDFLHSLSTISKHGHQSKSGCHTAREWEYLGRGWRMLFEEICSRANFVPSIHTLLFIFLIGDAGSIPAASTTLKFQDVGISLTGCTHCSYGVLYEILDEDLKTVAEVTIESLVADWKENP